MKISDVCAELEEYAPLSLAEDFDNVGLLVGRGDEDVTSVLLTLDVDMAVAHEAKELGANMIVSHHPIIFEPVKRINTQAPLGELLLYLIENRIDVYAAHTNLDSAKGGINDVLAGLIGLKACVPLLGESAETGLGRIGELEESVKTCELASKLKTILGLPYIRFTGNGQKTIKRVALCSGGGGSLLHDAIESGADIYITGDLKYHNVRDAVDCGIDIIEVGHYDSEIIAPRLFQKILSPKFKTHLTTANKNIFNIV